MLDNYVTMDQLKSISSINDQCRILIDDSTGGDAKVATANTLKTYIINDIEDAVALKANKTELHTHNNKELLDKLSTDTNGNLLYNSQTLVNYNAVNDINMSLTTKSGAFLYETAISVQQAVLKQNGKVVSGHIYGILNISTINTWVDVASIHYVDITTAGNGSYPIISVLGVSGVLCWLSTTGMVKVYTPTTIGSKPFQIKIDYVL